MMRFDCVDLLGHLAIANFVRPPSAPRPPPWAGRAGLLRHTLRVSGELLDRVRPVRPCAVECPGARCSCSVGVVVCNPGDVLRDLLLLLAEFAGAARQVLDRLPLRRCSALPRHSAPPDAAGRARCFLAAPTPVAACRIASAASCSLRAASASSGGILVARQLFQLARLLFHLPRELALRTAGGTPARSASRDNCWLARDSWPPVGRPCWPAPCCRAPCWPPPCPGPAPCWPRSAGLLTGSLLQCLRHALLPFVLLLLARGKLLAVFPASNRAPAARRSTPRCAVLRTGSSACRSATRTGRQDPAALQHRRLRHHRRRHPRRCRTVMSRYASSAACRCCSARSWAGIASPITWRPRPSSAGFIALAALSSSACDQNESRCPCCATPRAAIWARLRRDVAVQLSLRDRQRGRVRAPVPVGWSWHCRAAS